MSFASGARVQLSYVVESTPGVTPGSPTMALMRLTGFDINPSKGELRSNEVLADRQTLSLRHGMLSVEGTLAGELALQVHDDMIEAALSGTWDGTIAESGDIGVTNPASVVRSTGSFITDGFMPGMVVLLDNLSVGAEEGNYLITAVSALTITLAKLDGSAINLTTEAANSTPTLTIVGEICKVGTTLRTFTMERGFLDIAQYEPYLGVAINSMSIGLTTDAIPTISFGVIGMGFDAASGTSLDASPTAAPTNEAMSPFVGKIYEGGTAIAILTAFSPDLANNRSLQGVIGGNQSAGVFEGDAVVTGQLTALFQDAALFNKFVNETETSIWARMTDPADSTQFINVILPRVKYMGATKSPPKTGPVLMTMPFGAFKHATFGTTMAIQKSNT